MSEESHSVSLRKITPENYQQIIEMRVREDQMRFVASNLNSLAESAVFPQRSPLAIYNSETPVGFLMFAYIETTQQHWIFRVMIAAEQQGRGYGKAAMRLLIEHMRSIPGCKRIYISYEPDNQVARSLYASLGFCSDGEIQEGEEVAYLDVSS